MADWKHKEDEECGCCIEIEDSLVIIVCGEIDRKKLHDCLKTFVDIKGGNSVRSE